MRNKIIFSLLVLGAIGLSAQTDSLKTKKSSFYVTWGYTKAYYTKSTIHFVNNSGTGIKKNYDFTIHDATAHDRMDLDKTGDIVNVTIPQFVFRIGYRFNNKWGIELNYDHTKYVVDDYQTVRVTGRFDDHWIDSNMVLDPNTFLHFEHTDGANFWMINYMKRNKIFYSKKNNFKLSYVFKPGTGILIPRTDVTIFGNRVNNNFKVAGFCAGIETSLHVEMYKHFILELAAKGGYANYMNVFVYEKGNGKASHQIGFLEGIFTFGYQF